ncbi:universal stress protein family protein [Mycolicibacterium mageritense DSM 44476 = CIP 104973]|uniref:Universal stress protein n=1 Tax=Mycolicibacterium mageritense TaxID=53462 RepID=A0ABN5Y283_MYCME|nr:universal stress protein [Mycolicibacterium mageritense]MBN3458042.1 universal stress protein [Mycobacterium sp. DSM 3803]OKH64432.1 universal stress protein [Mycobacterium sp. SWH-M3]MCC9181940.1 universal stress protein [Mycolicibacterium mageritense]TXI63568.1 MAG: universal stress protein [Mycolicibacterium mageritense]CDO25248.1 universal stress protein family protein [Mycolicibacterium mageritense DSM 44476 = CIP 104973]
MTILAAFSASRHSSAPLHLATQIARSTGDSVVAAAVVERPWPPKGDPVEQEYLDYITTQATQILDRAVSALPSDVEIPTVVHQSTSVPSGLLELAVAHQANLVVVGSSSAGLLGRVALGSVTERLVHTAEMPVAIAPRGYSQSAGRIRRLTASYGGEADVNGLIPAAAELAKAWSATLRIVSFTVRNVVAFAGVIESSAEDLVVQQWSKRTYDEIVKRLNEVRERMDVPDVDVVVGTGHDWNSAVQSVPWAAGDMLVMGSGAAAQTSHVFLGSAAAKILRHAPVPVMIVPRHQPT